MLISTCEVCSSEIKAFVSRRFCSRECYGKSQASKYKNDRITKTCAFCNASYEIRPSKSALSRFCSFACSQKGKAVESADTRSEKLRGKGTAPDGGILPTTYPKFKGRHLHRIVAEQKLGRKLKASEIVHHRNENRQDASPDNLEVLPNQAAHWRKHFKGNKYESEYQEYQRRSQA